MSQHLILAGGGHAHMMILANLHRFIRQGHRVTVIQPSPYHYYSGMGPGMLGRNYTPEEIRFATRHVVEKQGGRFVPGKVTRIDSERKTVHLEDGASLPYNVLSCNVGSYVPRSFVSGNSEHVFTVKPIEKLLGAREKILKGAAEKKIKVAIVGGGASAVEIAGNVWALTNTKNLHSAEITIFARSSLMQNSPGRVRTLAIRSLETRDINFVEDCEVTAIHGDSVELAAGEKYRADIIFVAVGVKPSPLFQESGLTSGPEDGLMVNSFLQSVDSPYIFGGGDCIYFEENPLDKVGVYAVRENPILLNNISAALDGATPLKRFNPGGDYLLIYNLGDGTGIFRKKFITFNGKPAFLIKDYIDRRFMKKFQSLE